jgi:tetratricopeptide (TPR) repeat protein
MASAAQLDDATHERIKALCAEGDRLARNQEFDAAKSKYIEALRSLPEPQQHWEAATWIYASLGDVHFKMGNFEKTMRCYVNAVQCPGGLGNPYLHLRLGQAYFELGNFDKSADELTRAYMGAGMDIFMEDDGKYLEFLETKIEL